MTRDAFRRALILTGPTGSGKSRLALDLAARHNAEIVAMDSMTLYRSMDIGTAKPTCAERAAVPHYLIDVLDPWQSASVAWWLEHAAAAVRDIESRGKVALVVGGTALYLKAVMFGLFDSPPSDEALRKQLEAEDPHALHERLRTLDPPTAARLHPNDVRRVVRALEVHTLTGQPISDWQTQWVNSPPTAEALYLDLPRDQLYARIERRVDQMLRDGLLDEVRRLRDLDPPMSREARQALGYKELLDHLDGRCSLDDAVREVKTRSRNFAKRQLTWFRHLPGCESATEELTIDRWASRMR